MKLVPEPWITLRNTEALIYLENFLFFIFPFFYRNLFRKLDVILFISFMLKLEYVESRNFCETNGIPFSIK